MRRKQPPSRKVLRTGVVQNDRIIDEQVIPAGKRVTIGDDRRNTLVVRGAGLPARRTLLAFRKGRYFLVLDGKQEVKIVSARGAVTGKEVTTWAESRTRNGVTWVPLEEDMRGKVVFPGATVLFQFVPRPAGKRSRPPPFTARAWLGQRDPVFAAVFAASLLLHSTVMGYALSQPPPPRLEWEEVVDRFPVRLFPNRKVPGSTPAPVLDSPPAAQDTREEPARTPVPRSMREAGSDAVPSRAGARPGERVLRIGILGALTDLKQKRRGLPVLSAGSGPLPGGEDLLAMLDRGAQGMATVSAAERAGLRGGRLETGIIGSTRMDSVASRADIHTGRREARHTPSARIAPVQPGTGVATAGLDAVIARHVGAITSCYEMALKTNPGLAGKIYLTFTVEESGRVSHVEVDGPPARDDRLAACVVRRVKRWAFSPLEAPVEVTVPVVLTSAG